MNTAIIVLKAQLEYSSSFAGVHKLKSFNKQIHRSTPFKAFNLFEIFEGRAKQSDTSSKNSGSLVLPKKLKLGSVATRPQSSSYYALYQNNINMSILSYYSCNKKPFCSRRAFCCLFGVDIDYGGQALFSVEKLFELCAKAYGAGNGSVNGVIAT